MWFRNQFVPVCGINATNTENPGSETRMGKGVLFIRGQLGPEKGTQN
jgi:hypothetical protein